MDSQCVLLSLLGWMDRKQRPAAVCFVSPAEFLASLSLSGRGCTEAILHQHDMKHTGVLPNLLFVYVELQACTHSVPL